MRDEVKRRAGTHAHVSGRADEGVGDGVDELAGHAKITALDLALRVEEDVRGFDVVMQDPRGMQCIKAEHLLSI